jgi:hypothetical protein
MTQVVVDTPAAGDPIPANHEIIEVSISDLRRLFNVIDPAPLPDRDLDPKVEEFIVGWGREARRDVQLALLIIVDGPVGPPEEVALSRDAIHRFFAQAANVARRRLRRLFHTGRISLAIGLTVLAALAGLGQLIASRMSSSGVGAVLRESLSIGGWVAMWRPLEVFLYDWWPIRAEAKLYDRLAAMPVHVRVRG